VQVDRTVAEAVSDTQCDSWTTRCLYVQVDRTVVEAVSDTQCDSCFETATSAAAPRTLNGVCVVSPAVVHCAGCVQNLCASCCARPCNTQHNHDDNVCDKYVRFVQQARTAVG